MDSNTKRALVLTALFFLCMPTTTYAAVAASWSATSTNIGAITPARINGNDPIVKAASFIGTSTATSTLAGGLNIQAGGLTIASLSGFLKAVSGVLQTALISLTTDVSGTLPVPNGGTGVGTFTTGLLGGSGTNNLFTQATTTACSGTGLTFSGTCGAQVGGTNGTYSVNTSQNISTLSNLTTNGFVQTSGGTGALSSAALTSGQVTTALGYTPANFSWPFTQTTDFGINTSATTTALFGRSSIFASSTSATIPALVASNTTGNALQASGLTLSGHFGTTTCPTPNTTVVGAAASVEICGDDNTDGGVNLILGNQNSGTAAFTDLYLQNDASIGNTGAFAVLNFNSFNHTNIDFGQIPSIAAGLQLYNQEGSLELGSATTSLTNGYTSIFGGGLNFSNELARFSPISGGRVGIGSSTPHAALAVNAPNTAPTENIFEASYSTGATNAATTTVFSIATSTGTAVNIATTSAIGSNVLTVNGGVYFHGLATGAGNGALCATTDGLVSYDAGANCIVSSARFKTLVQGLTGGTGVSEIAKLNPVSFFYKPGYGDNGTQEHVGLIAEDVAKVDPRLVIYDKDNKPFSLHFEEFIPLFVQSIQDILTRMDSQQAEIDTLKAQVKALQDAQQRPIPKPL